jgi:SAM-dependent methyltransferase
VSLSAESARGSRQSGAVEHHVAKKELQQFIDASIAGRHGLAVLEAGCGSASHVRLPADTHLAGIDISRMQLDRSEVLDERIEGDIETYPLPKNAYDLVVCWYVIEHLPNPEKAMDNLVSALAPGGLLVLVLPNVYSVKGLVTKFTPHRFHVWFYRQVLGWKEAGRDDRGPFKTYLRLSTSASAIDRFGSDRGMTTVFYQEFLGFMQMKLRRDRRYADIAFRLLSPILKFVTFGMISIDSTEYMIVLRKRKERGNETAHPSANAVI